MNSKKSIEKFEGFEICNTDQIKGGVDTKACITIEMKVCITAELKKCYSMEIQCPSSFSVKTDDGKSVGW